MIQTVISTNVNVVADLGQLPPDRDGLRDAKASYNTFARQHGPRNITKYDQRFTEHSSLIVT